MTNEQMKTILAKSGVAEADIGKVTDRFDMEKISMVIDAATTPESAMESLHALYPELEVSKLEEQMNFVQEQFEAATKENHNKNAVELTENELENVSGGSAVGDFINKHWKAILIGVAVTVGVALLCTGMGAAIGSSMGTVIDIEGLATGFVAATGTGALAGLGVGAGLGLLAGGATVYGLAKNTDL